MSAATEHNIETTVQDLDDSIDRSDIDANDEEDKEFEHSTKQILARQILEHHED